MRMFDAMLNVMVAIFIARIIFTIVFFTGLIYVVYLLLR